MNVIAGGYLGEEEVIPDPLVARDALWILLLYHLAGIAGLAFVAIAGNPVRHAGPDLAEQLPVTRMALATLAASILLLLWLFSEYGFSFLIPVLLGNVSAREIMSFDNFSASTEQSIRALLEVAVIFGAIFLLALQALHRQLLSAAGLLAMLALVLVFIGSGTRSLLLMGIVAVVLARLSGAMLAKTGPQTGRAALGLVGLAVLLVPVAITISARFATSTGQTNPVLGLFLVNNDMFRELVYIEANLAGFQTTNPLPFVQVPFTYVTPRFLGFTREIPEHVLAFNMARNGIDLILGAGNVFPGLIGDFRMAFGAWGQIWFAVFLAVYAAMLRWLGTLSGPGILLTAVQIATATFLFFSFRNIHPGLALVMIGAAMALLLLRAIARPATPARAHRA